MELNHRLLFGKLTLQAPVALVVTASDLNGFGLGSAKQERRLLQLLDFWCVTQHRIE